MPEGLSMGISTQATLRLPSSLDQLSIKELYEKYGEPEQFEVEICDCCESPFGPEAPELASNPIWLGKHPEQYPPSEARLLVADFGETYPPSTESQHGRDRHDPHYAPPEMRFDTEPKYSFHSDIWALGCTICEIFSEYPLLYHGYSRDEHVIAKHVDISGKPPQGWWEEWEARNQLFTEAGERLRSGWQHPSWESYFEEDIQHSWREARMPEFDVEERDALMELLQSTVRWEPEKRLTIQGVLNSRWMRNWALPEFERALGNE